ncbi:MAG: ABC transporter permease [Hyphomicrobiales bacterium]
MSASVALEQQTLPSESRFTRLRQSSLMVDGLWKMMHTFTGVASVALLAAILVAAFVLPPVMGLDPLEQFRGERLQLPSWDHWFGTDEASRDLFARCLGGLRVSILVGCGAVLLGSVIGSTVGYIAGYAGGLVDSVLMRLIDAVLAFPTLLMALVILVVLGNGMDKVALAIGLANVPIFARLARAGLLQQSRRDYVLAARALGCTPVRIVGRHIVVNTLPPLIVQAALSMAFAVLVEAGLSYLGLGIQPPNPSLGNLMSVGRNYMLSGGTYYVLLPALVLAAMMFALNLLADSLNDTFDPKRRR